MVGAIAALALTRLIADVLYKVSPRDPIAFGLACAVMILIAVGACLLPASRAAHVDSVRALRQ